MHTSAEALIGTLIEGYRITRVLGTGSTSTVYEARRDTDAGADITTNSATERARGKGRGTTTTASKRSTSDLPDTVAVKVLMPQYVGAHTDSKEAARRFLREARAATQLTHPHILPVLNYGEVDDLIYMLLPLIETGTLSEWLSQQAEPVSLAVAGNILRQTADALDYAHAQGIIHRDIKPSNLLRDRDGTVYLSDFGVARLMVADNSALILTEGPDHAALTQTGEALGTPYYMAPEQIRGDVVGPATDVYALGIVLFFLVTGQVPFQGDTPLAVALQHLQEEPCPPHLLRTDLPDGVEEVMLRALAKEPSDRYASAGEFARDFTAGLRLAMGDRASDEANTSDAVASGGGAAGGSMQTSDEDLVGQTLGDYTLGDFVARDDLGALFRARTAPSSLRYRLRILDDGNTLAALPDTSLRTLAEGTQALMGLRQPGLLPVIDTGVARGVVFVVSSQPTGNALADQLGEGTPLDLNVVDSYLAQVAAVLDWAHEHDLLHGSLTPSCVYVDEHGTAQVADLGVRPLLDVARGGTLSADEVTGSGAGDKSRIRSTTATSPEQVSGKPAERASDVYALGCLLYEMLAGRPVFSGTTAEEIAQQHLYNTPPTLRRVRTGLPSSLQNILNRALAKDPRQRYTHAGELARAYHEIITRAALGSSQSVSVAVPTGSHVSASLSSRAANQLGSSAKSGAAGPEGHTPPLRQLEQISEGGETHIASLPPMRGGNEEPAQTTAAPIPATDGVRGNSRQDPQRRAARASATARGAQTPREPDDTAGEDVAPRGVAHPIRNVPVRRLVLGGVSLLVLASLAFILFRALAPIPSATVAFTDSTATQNGLTDAVRISAQALPDPPHGTDYYAWVLDKSKETSLMLGKLVKHGDAYSISYTHKGDVPLGMLVGEDAVSIEVTAEPNTAVPIHWPRGKTVLSFAVPSASFIHIGHLLVHFPATPSHQGLIVGLLDQAQRLDAQALALQDAAKQKNTLAITCEAQSVIDIIEGKTGPSYAPLSSDCTSVGVTEAGDGFGILGNDGYDAGVSDHANLAVHGQGATDATKTHARNITYGVADIDQWASNADHSAWWLLHHPNDTSGVSSLVTNCVEVFQGNNPSGDGIAQPVKGQAGAQTIYHEGQLMATLTLSQPVA